jgi:organic radical activating enzyme
MAVLNQPGSDNPRNFDLSFMATLRCNLRCSFCMYNSGPEVNDQLDLALLERWLRTVDPTRISSFGLYGGEPSVDLRSFGRCMVLAKKVVGDRPGFVITNGSWSTDAEKTELFIFFAQMHQLFIVVSGTPEHRKFQNRDVLETLASTYPNAIRLKPKEENYHAMGRLEGKMPFSCSQKCMSWNKALRIAVQPDGSILFQNCDGVYPVVGTISEPFSALVQRVDRMRNCGFAERCSHYPIDIKKAA